MRFLRFAMAALTATGAWAVNPAFAACKVPISPASLNDFVDRPGHYLDRFPSGGDVLTESIRNFAAFDRSGLKAVRLAIRTANVLQKQAIGSGLARAVAACLPRDGEIAKQIADIVKMSGDQDIIGAFLIAADDEPDPVLGGAHGAAAGSQGTLVTSGQSLALPSIEAPKPVPDIKKIK